jgi:hypothetical protein
MKLAAVSGSLAAIAMRERKQPSTWRERALLHVM